MLTSMEIDTARNEAISMLAAAGIELTSEEKSGMEVADFGLGNLRASGLQIVVYVNTSRCCAKELVMSPRQTCPQHIHPPVGSDPGKEETFRCRWGEVYLYVPGEPSSVPACAPPTGHESYYTVWHEIKLTPGQQYTILPGTPHWFQSGDRGAIVSEFSTTSRDEFDIFEDPGIIRVPVN